MAFFILHSANVVYNKTDLRVIEPPHHSRDDSCLVMVNDSMLLNSVFVEDSASVLSETLTGTSFLLLGSHKKMIELWHGLTCLLSQPLGKAEARALEPPA